MIIKEQSYSQIELLETGHVQLRLTTKIIEDGEVISQTHHRTVVTPDDDITELPERIQNICNSHWDEDMLAKWQANNSN